MIHLRLICLLLLVNAYASYGQNQLDLNSYKGHFQLAEQFNGASLFAKSTEEINLALTIARKNKWQKKIVEASIFLAEIKRKTGDFNEGIAILRKLNYSINYPSLHVEKLGRMAALFHESKIPDLQKFDSVELYLKKALILADKYNLKSEKASLYNEVAYRIGHKQLDSCLYLLTEASRLFMEQKDTQNYIVARTNMLRTYETIGDSANVMSTFNELNALVADRGWNTLERELYVTISRFYAKKGDSVNGNFWMLKCKESDILNLENTSSIRLNSFRVLYETEKYQAEIDKKKRELAKAAKRRNELIIYFSIFVLLGLGVSLLLIRERTLKHKLRKANDSYQMLLVESNHRIKNNLQMILSMLNFSSKNVKKEDAVAFERMSSKIMTISALHKELYLDIHNERVDIDSYFSAILELNQKIASSNLQIKKRIAPVSIKSERIVYFGLIFNEMLSNTFEHNTATTGTITISIQKVDDLFQFTYQDNASFNQENQYGTGIKLIKQLVGRVGGTDFRLHSETGKYTFNFAE